MIHSNAKFVKFEVRAKKTLITLGSKGTVAVGAWVFLQSAQFYSASVSATSCSKPLT
jgi:hypothetical protein